MTKPSLCVFALLSLLSAQPAGAQAPGQATAAVAAGDVAGSRPTFSWGAVSGATWYYLWVRDSTGTDKWIQWYTAEALGCATGPVCSVTLDLTLSPGVAEWWVQTWNASGFGPWSATRSVRVSPLYTAGTSAFFGSYPPSSASGAGNIGIGASVLTALTTGGRNVAIGQQAMSVAGGAADNVAVGANAMKSTTAGNANVAVGSHAMFKNTSGAENTAIGQSALFANLTGSYNTAVGLSALGNATSHSNVALGAFAGVNVVSGVNNVFLGYGAGQTIAGDGSFNIMIGNSGTAGDTNIIRIGSGQAAAYLAGVYASTVSSRAVYVDNTGRLGTLSSSRATKRNIRPLGDASARLFDLRPVAFQYRSSPAGSRDVEYGLIAEEVAKTFPELVDRGMSGKPETVRYHLLTPLLLNELQKARADVDALKEERRKARADVDTLIEELRAMKARVAALEARSPERR